MFFSWTTIIHHRYTCGMVICPLWDKISAGYLKKWSCSIPDFFRGMRHFLYPNWLLFLKGDGTHLTRPHGRFTGWCYSARHHAKRRSDLRCAERAAWVVQLCHTCFGAFGPAEIFQSFWNWHSIKILSIYLVLLLVFTGTFEIAHSCLSRVPDTWKARTTLHCRPP